MTVESLLVMVDQPLGARVALAKRRLRPASPPYARRPTPHPEPESDGWL